MTADDERRAAVLELRARQLAAHGLTQRFDGDDGLGAAIDAACVDADPADVFARALGLLFNSLDAAESAELADRIRAGIPPLMLKIEGTQHD